MILLGADPHKSTHTTTALDPAVNQPLGSLRIQAALPEYRRLLRWARRFPQRQWAVEKAGGLGRHLSQWLLARGEVVLDVPSSATARVRQLSRGGGRKNDEIDAAAAATIAALHGDARRVPPEDQSTVLALLDERRVNLTQARVRAVNQLHALLRDLIPGGAPRQLSADQAGLLLRRIRPSGPVETVRTQLAGELVREIRTRDAQLTDNAARMQAAVEASGSTLMRTPGIGPVMAARLIARTGRAEQFASSAAYANYCGAAPVQIASADKTRHRLSRRGDRQLNSALHTIAVIQIRLPDSPGHAYYQRKLTEGKSPKETKRCLKRRLADHVWRVMLADEQRHARAADPADTRGRLSIPARPAQPRRPALQTSHDPDPPTASLRLTEPVERPQLPLQLRIRAERSQRRSTTPSTT